jgi:hypothetical protein
MNIFELHIISGVDLLSEEAQEIVRKKLGSKKRKKEVKEKDILMKLKVDNFLDRCQKNNAEKKSK